MTKMRTKMKTTLLLLLFFVAHADASDLKCSKKTIAELGKDVTLDCYCEPRCHVTGEVLKWKFNQKTFVLFYVGTSDAKNQDLQFKGRAQVSSTARLNDGNFPVTISKVRKRDEGTYTCHVGSKTCSVELKAQEFKLKCQEKPVEVRVGKNVTLNCTSEPQRDLTKKTITWKFKITKVVYMYREKGFLNEDYQDDQFRDRVHLVSGWKVSEGKLSVEISTINESDAGNYTCSVYNGPKCTVTLIVKKEDKQTPGAQEDNIPTTTAGAPGDNIPTTSCGFSTGAIIGAFLGGVLVGAVIGALVTWKFHEKCKSLLSCIGTQRGGEQDDRRPSREGIELPSTTQNQERSPSEADPLTAPS